MVCFQIKQQQYSREQSKGNAWYQRVEDRTMRLEGVGWQRSGKVPEERCRPTILREALGCVQSTSHPCYNMSAAREASEAHIWNAAKELQLSTRATAPFVPHSFGRIRSLFPHPGFIYIYLYSWFGEETLSWGRGKGLHGSWRLKPKAFRCAIRREEKQNKKKRFFSCAPFSSFMLSNCHKTFSRDHSDCN